MKRVHVSFEYKYKHIESKKIKKYKIKKNFKSKKYKIT